MRITLSNINWHPSRLPNNMYSTLAYYGCLLIVDEEELTISLVHYCFKQYLINKDQQSSYITISIDNANRRISGLIISDLNFLAFEYQLSTNVVPNIQPSAALSGIIHSTSDSLVHMSRLTLKLLRSKILKTTLIST